MTSDDQLSPWPDPPPPATPSSAGGPPRDERWAQLHDTSTPRGGEQYRALLGELRAVQDRVSGGAPPPELAEQLAAQLRRMSEALAAHQVDEAHRWDGWHPDFAGRGLPVLPPYFVDEFDGASLSGRVTFTRFYLGGNAAAHGGTQPLLFDDVFGRIANHGFPGVARTAYLHVNYRNITPLDVELHFHAHRDRVDGRKRWVHGRIERPDGTLACDAEGLFLQLLPGQQ